MSIYLYFSNNTKMLADMLAKNISTNYIIGKINIFNNPIIAIPNMNLAKWLKIILAKKISICMNLDFQSFHDVLSTMVKILDPQYFKSNFSEINVMQLILLSILRSSDSSKHEILPINEYLLSKSGFKSSDFDIKAWQLCKELAILFKKYEYFYPEMIQQWKKGVIPSSNMENCQKWLYLKSLRIKKIFSKDNKNNLFSLYDYYNEILLNKNINDNTQQKQQVYLFGLYNISQFHLMLLNYLEQHFNIHIYSINPSKEYWEDVIIPHRKNSKRTNLIQDNSFNKITNFNYFEDTNNELLSLWGKPCCDNIKSFCQLTNYNFDSKFINDTINNDVLNNIKNQILTLENSSKKLEQDCSLQIVSCPSIKREVETVYNSILNNLEHDDKLLLTDIAIIVINIAQYKPIINSVFSQCSNKIKYNFTDNICIENSVFFQAVMSILDLSMSNFNRNNVFKFFHNPCVMKYWEYDHEELNIWIKWSDKLGIFHNFEKKENQNENQNKNLPSAGLHTWRQGLERIRLSRIMNLPEFNIGENRLNFMGLVPFEDLHTNNIKIVEKFCTILEVLHNILLTFKIDKSNLGTWLALILKAINNFLRIPDELKQEEKIYKSFIKYFDELLFYDNLETYSSNTIENKLELNTIKIILIDFFSNISNNYSEYLTDGVTISSLIPIRSIPFKIVYFVGLNEGEFPGKVYHNPIDLKIKKRKIGEANIVENNKYSFLEILFLTEKKLYLSYVSKNLKRNQDLQPCSVINQLQRYIENKILKENTKFNIVKIPFRGSDCIYYTQNSHKWTDVLVNYSISDFIFFIKINNFCSINNYSNTIREKIIKMNPDLSLHKIEEQHLESNLKINLTDLKLFLFDPVNAKIRHHVGIYEKPFHDESILISEQENEPFTTLNSINFNLKKVCIENWLLYMMFNRKNNTSNLLPNFIEHEFDMLYDDYMRKSITPSGAFASYDRRLIKEQIVSFINKLIPVINSIQGSIVFYSDIILGAPKRHRIINNKFSKVLKYKSKKLNIKLKKKGQYEYLTVVLEGSIKWVWKDINKNWNILIPLWFIEKIQYPEQYIMESFLFFLALISNYTENELNRNMCIIFHVVYKTGINKLTYLIDATNARKYLIKLLEDYLNFSNLIWLPADVIISNKNMRKLVSKQTAKSYEIDYFLKDMEIIFKSHINNNSILSQAILPYNILEVAQERFNIFLRPVKY